MRITNTTIARNYTSNLNKNLERLNTSSSKVGGRKYNTMAEDPSSAVRAMIVRRNLAKVESYIDNTKNVQATFTSAESSLMQISGMTADIRGLYTSVDGGEGPEDLKIIASQLERYRDEIVSLANSQFSDNYLFGGTNTKSPPFSFDDDNNLLYNGVKVADINKNDPQYAYLFEDAAYIDLGLGMTMKDGIQSQGVVENSAFKTTLVGLDFLGAGKDNIINVMQEMIDSIKGGDYNAEKSGALLTRFNAAAENVSVSLTNLGSDTQYLDFTLSRLEDQKFSLTERQDTLEFPDIYESVMDMEMSQYVYNAALQMGTRLFQPTLFDFLG